MKVSTDQPFKVIYSLFAHEYLGYLFESFAVQLDDQQRFTFEHQNISHLNAHEFAQDLDEDDYRLIKLMDSMQQEVVIQKFHKKKIKPHEFFFKVFEGDSERQQQVRNEIDRYLEDIRTQVLPLLNGKSLFEMSNDGEPVGNPIEVMKEKATVLFHFRRNEENTHYFPTIKHRGEKLDFQYKNAYIVCREPAWMVLEGKLYTFEKDVDGNKLAPFLKRKFIVIPRKVEDSYYRKFVAPLVASFDVYAKGFDIRSESHRPQPHLTFYEVHPDAADASGNPARGATAISSTGSEAEDIAFELTFAYGEHRLVPNQKEAVSVVVEQEDDQYTFRRIVRDMAREIGVMHLLKDQSLDFHEWPAVLDKNKAIDWINRHRPQLEEAGVVVHQQRTGGRKYFLGPSSINVQVRENIDWFDIHAVVCFGDYQIPFKKLRSSILAKKRELLLPSGEIAIIPEAWFTEYSELFALAEKAGDDSDDTVRLKKHHLTLVQDLQHGERAQVTIDRKLERLRNFSKIEDFPMPEHFRGELRPYQKAGYNWMHFLNQYRFGGCLADDMGLGKTVQTLALLQRQKEQRGAVGDGPTTSLLVMPTSLIYNWEMEAKKFTPQLKVFIYTGTNRDKNVEQFAHYDLVLTSYGIARIDIDILRDYYFNYVILDESQAIKNPNSAIAKTVREFNTRHRLILTGTPLENSTLDLWSQMTFINPGLLGTKTFFKNEFVTPIEKKGDTNKSEKLHAIIKPFILRRQKWQVATELPEKIENVTYCAMTEAQEARYEETKSFYRNEILDLIEHKGIQKSQLLLLQGLTQLRQIANHPRMVDEQYAEESGKMKDMMHMLTSAISEGHNILIFSQFVKHLTLVSEQLQERDVAYAYLDGSTKNRQEQVESFQEDQRLRVFLISLRAGGVGLNLTKADYVFILDPWWNPAVEKQAVDRAHRIGQENRVFTYKFITRDTVEEKILRLQESKLKLATDLISTEESFVKKLTRDDISAILS
jgi:hypothetical protein